ncbi:helix-turn-helix domain-containing protein [Pectobacterium brasiliense]|uniref:TetR/AcrR family transcriptional regulator n=1 Tax=Pectobacterium brasiliense TaxID=180957 RepID=UPI002A7ED616|nr:helix-turn-helix domain-containing protein [Pectobacterium brasiliense]MDY4369330.1 helix-turn-helix domain-containing protein [Pectobacterium brasiliense]MDY7058863.1 helix-turn-helix domain-containing protein [Pectobacterium brasiliense]
MKTRDFAKKAIQEQIALAALRRFQKNGFENTTVEDIANDMEMSTRTYFRYFRSKDDVLLGPIQSFASRFLEIFGENLCSLDLWSSLEIALGESALNCEKFDPSRLGAEMQVIIRSTPILFAKQLEIIERLQIEATDLYFAKYASAGKINWGTANAIIRSGFSCLHALQSGNPTHAEGEMALSQLRQLMLELRPNILTQFQSR